MDQKLSGALLLSAAGLVAAIGTASAQIANAIVLGGYYAGNMTGVNPPGPQEAIPHRLVITAVILLALAGLYFLFKPNRE